MAFSASDFEALAKAGVDRNAVASAYGQEVADQYTAWAGQGTGTGDRFEYDPNWGGAVINPAGRITESPAFAQGSGYVAPNPKVASDMARYRTDQVNNQFGSDLSWLDPTFQQTPTMLGQSQASQAYADPAAIQAQYGALSGMQGLANTPMQWMSGQQQQDMYNQLLNVQAPQWDTQAAGRQNSAYNMLGGIQGPSFESSARQEDVYNTARARARGEGAPQFMGEADQRSVFNRLGSIADSGGSQGITYDDGARQAEQYGNLNEIIAGGGNTAIEMAARARQRADSDQWLRSQREADQAEYQMRGLSGSGQERLDLAADRQAAAGRNSLADLEMAAQLEQRRMDAIGQAGGLAEIMRGQTAQEQQFNAARGDSALAGQGNMANAMRQSDYLDKSYLDQSMLEALGISGNQANALRQDRYTEELGRTGFELNQANSMGNLATNMRQGTFQEQSYQNEAAMRQAMGAADIAGQMRQQTFSENSFARQNQTQLYGDMGNLSSNIRDSSYNEQYGRGTAADAFSMLNNQSINTASQQNTQFLQDAYQNMIIQRNQNDRARLATGVDVAGTMAGIDARNAQFDVSTFNNQKAAYDAMMSGTYGSGVPSSQAGAFELGGDTATKAGMAVASAYTGGAAGAAAGGGLSTQGDTWAGGGQPNQGGGIGSTTQALIHQPLAYDPNAENARKKKAMYG